MRECPPPEWPWRGHGPLRVEAWFSGLSSLNCPEMAGRHTQKPHPHSRAPCGCWEVSVELGLELPRVNCRETEVTLHGESLLCAIPHLEKVHVMPCLQGHQSCWVFPEPLPCSGPSQGSGSTGSLPFASRVPCVPLRELGRSSSFCWGLTHHLLRSAMPPGDPTGTSRSYGLKRNRGFSATKCRTTRNSDERVPQTAVPRTYGLPSPGPGGTPHASHTPRDETEELRA